MHKGTDKQDSGKGKAAGFQKGDRNGEEIKINERADIGTKARCTIGVGRVAGCCSGGKRV